MPERGVAHLRRRRPGGALPLGEEVQRHPRPRRHDQAESLAVALRLLRLHLRVHRLPPLPLVGHDHRAGGRRPHQLRPPSPQLALARPLQRHLPQESVAEAIHPHPILQPVPVPPQPGQNRRQVPLTPGTAHRPVHRIVHHHLVRLRRPHRRWPPPPLPSASPLLRVGEGTSGFAPRNHVGESLLLPVPQLPLPVLLVRHHLGNVHRRDRAHIAHSVRRIAGEQQEQLPRPRQLIAPRPQPQADPVLRMAPEAIQELPHPLVLAAQPDPLAHHVVRRQRHDPPRQRVVPPGLQRLHQVAPRLVPGAILRPQAHLLPPAVVHLPHRLAHPLLDIRTE